MPQTKAFYSHFLIIRYTSHNLLTPFVYTLTLRLFHTRCLHINPARSFPQIAYTYIQSLRVKRSAYSSTHIFLSYIYHTHRPHCIYSFSQNIHKLAQFNQITLILIYTQYSQTVRIHSNFYFFHILKPLFHTGILHIYIQNLFTPTSFLIYGHISIQTCLSFLNLYKFFQTNIICLDFNYSFHTVWLYHRHRLFSQTHKTFSLPLHFIPIICFLHILRILSHTSLYHINNYRSIQTYIIHNSIYVLSHFSFMHFDKSFSFTFCSYSLTYQISSYCALSIYCEHVFIYVQYSIDISLLFNSNILSTHSLTSFFHTSYVYVYIRLYNSIHTSNVIIDGLGSFILIS